MFSCFVLDTLKKAVRNSLIMMHVPSVLASRPRRSECESDSRRYAELCGHRCSNLQLSVTLLCFKTTYEAIGASFVMSRKQNVMIVSDVETGLPAEEAGGQVGDVVLAVDGTSIQNCSSTLAACVKTNGSCLLQSVNRKRFLITKKPEGRLGKALDAVSPVQVINIQPDGLAMRCGLHEGDELLSINGFFPSHVEQAEKLIAEFRGPLCLEVRLPRPRDSMVGFRRLWWPSGQGKRHDSSNEKTYQWMSSQLDVDLDELELSI